MSTAGGGTWRLGLPESVEIPISKVVHLVFDAEDGCPTGIGLWRSMYPHWYVKQATYQVIGIGIERNLVGVPYAEMAEGAQLDDRDQVLEMLARLRAAEDAAVALPFGWKMNWFESERSLVDAMPYIQHHDALIARAGLAQFLNLGQTTTGTQALAEEQVRVFLDAEEANARWIEQTLNQQLIRRWCLLNYGPRMRCPVLRHRKIQADNFESLARALRLLVEGRLITVGVEDEEQIRDLAELPAIPREQLLARRLEARR
jgi:phage gp29-like protein